MSKEQTITATIVLSTFDHQRGRKVRVEVRDMAELERLSRESELYLQKYTEMKLDWKYVAQIFKKPQTRAWVMAG